ncbi:hypothetical protein HG263_02980 [Pseudoalteromonas sp. JBTF-M23]|uniref:Uncharacterized protein n=1 Tax=Pseudoalteromonas caenipelagi TaxID=2726988 RepID=A0A849V856_9GAMM|nr:hypothetical protein [Pseudoalteromonas caenipelagi]NOU49512.1 hypothetical protein [Pseudoalteromonas caenipelagi]
MSNPFTLVHADVCRASTSTIFIDSIAAEPVNNPLTQNLPVYGREQYFANSLVQPLVQPVLIKFTSFGNTNLGSFAGGHQLGEWLQVNECIVVGGENLALVNPNTGDDNWFSTGNTISEHSQVTAHIMIATIGEGEEFTAMPQMDVIAAPNQFAQTFPKGVMGRYNLNHVPDGSNTAFNLTRQAQADGPNFCAYNQGGSWLDATNAMNLNVATNTISNGQILAPNNVAIYFYDAQ